MMIIKFQELKTSAVKQLPCPICGKKLRRQKKFTMTLNPFNKNPETGEPRTAGEIYVELYRLADEWRADPEYCAECLETVEI